jgi:hypothetical protein
MAAISNNNMDVFNTAVTSNSSTALHPVGSLRFETYGTNGLKVYKYILAGTAIANGDVLSDSGVAGTAAGVSTVNTPGKIPATGIGVGTITNAYYGWMLVEGYHSAIKKPTTATVSALKVCYHLCGKAQVALNGEGVSAKMFVDNIVSLSTKASSCTTFPGIVRLM